MNSDLFNSNWILTKYTLNDTSPSYSYETLNPHQLLFANNWVDQGTALLSIDRLKQLLWQHLTICLRAFGSLLVFYICIFHQPCMKRCYWFLVPNHFVCCSSNTLQWSSCNEIIGPTAKVLGTVYLWCCVWNISIWINKKGKLKYQHNKRGTSNDVNKSNKR